MCRGCRPGRFEPTRNVIAYVNQPLSGPTAPGGPDLRGARLRAGADRDRVRGFAPLGTIRAFQTLPDGDGVGGGADAAGVALALWLPFNKPVWTASYILFTGGFGALLLGTLYALLDVKKTADIWRSGPLPLVIFGSNAIVAYVTPILVKLYILRVWTWPGTHVPLEQAFLHTAVRRWGP